MQPDNSLRHEALFLEEQQIVCYEVEIQTEEYGRLGYEE